MLLTIIGFLLKFKKKRVSCQKLYKFRELQKKIFKAFQCQLLLCYFCISAIMFAGLVNGISVHSIRVSRLQPKEYQCITASSLFVFQPFFLIIQKSFVIHMPIPLLTDKIACPFNELNSSLVQHILTVSNDFWVKKLSFVFFLQSFKYLFTFIHSFLK